MEELLRCENESDCRKSEQKQCNSESDWKEATDREKMNLIEQEVPCDQKGQYH